jgi:putative transposase
MQQALARRQPSARSRSHVREIPLQRRYRIAGSGENNSCTAVPGDLPHQARNERPTEEIQPGTAAITGPEVLEESIQVIEDLLTGAEAPWDVEPSAASAAERLDGVDHGVDRARSLVAPAAPSAGTATDGAERVDQPTVDVAGDRVHDAPPSNGHTAEEGRPAAVVPTEGALLDGDGPMVSDQAWAWIEALLPSSTGRRGGRWRDHRQVVEAICWKYRTGTPWRELPAQFGPWHTAFERLTRWRADGTWARLLAQARTDANAARELDWLVAVDTTGARVHRHDESLRRVGGTAATATASPDAPEDGAATPEDSAAA